MIDLSRKFGNSCTDGQDGVAMGCLLSGLRMLSTDVGSERPPLLHADEAVGKEEKNVN